MAQWMSCQKHFTPHVRTISRSFHDPHRAQRITTTPPETRVRGEGGGAMASEAPDSEGGALASPSQSPSPYSQGQARAYMSYTGLFSCQLPC